LGILDFDGHVIARKRPDIGRLSAPFGVEHRLIQHDVVSVLTVEDVEDDRLEVGPFRLLVVELLRFRELEDPFVYPRSRLVLFIVSLLAVASRNERVEVVGDLDARTVFGRDLLDHIGLDTAAVVQFDDFL